jgi:hypothetical protein
MRYALKRLSSVSVLRSGESIPRIPSSFPGAFFLCDGKNG